MGRGSDFTHGDNEMSERKPTPGELCDCGRPAVTVYVLDGRETPYCGIPDGGATDAETADQ